jgi:transcriptional regulator with XRE-family HTH domain
VEAVNGLYGGGWISHESTGGPQVSHAQFMTALASALLIGTGGLMTADYFAKRNERGYKFSQVQSSPAHQGLGLRSPAGNLARVRAVLKPAVSDLAALFRVSRQAVYDWQNGTQPAIENAARLEDLAKAADILLGEGIAASPHLLKRRIAGGETLFDAVREGRSAEEAARRLVQTVRHELDQRNALDSRLAGRRRPPIDYADAGVPTLDKRT